VPYYCAKNNMTIGITDCMQKFENIDVETITEQTKTYASSGMIDETSNMMNDRVYIFDGKNDTIVAPGYTRLLIMPPPLG